MSDKYNIDDVTRFLVLYYDAGMELEEIRRIINRPKRPKPFIRRTHNSSNSRRDEDGDDPKKCPGIRRRNML